VSTRSLNQNTADWDPPNSNKIRKTLGPKGARVVKARPPCKNAILNLRSFDAIQWRIGSVMWIAAILRRWIETLITVHCAARVRR
jgi:hypothetical protein